MSGNVFTVILKPIGQSKNLHQNAVLRVKSDSLSQSQYAVTVSGSEISGAISLLTLIFCDGKKVFKHNLSDETFFVNLDTVPENFSACVYQKDFLPLYYGERGNPILNAEGLMRYAKTDFENETVSLKAARQEVYDDDAIAEYDYYQKERRLNDAGENAHYADAQKEDFKLGKAQRYEQKTDCDETDALKSADKDDKYGDFACRAESCGVSETAEIGKTKSRRAKFLSLFLSGERVFDFKRTMPFLRLAKLSSGGKTILIGEMEISNETYYAYGVYGKRGELPESFSGKEWFFIPSDLFNKDSVGAYMIFSKNR